MQQICIGQTADPQKDIQALAAFIVSKKLTAPAIFLLEAHKPLRGVLQNVCIAASPVVEPLVSGLVWKRYLRILDSTQNIEHLIRSIEEYARA